MKKDSNNAELHYFLGYTIDRMQLWDATYMIIVDLPRTLEQENIDMAFQKPQRRSGATMEWENHSFLLLNSVNSKGAGIEKQRGFAVTNLERTLIDMCVRPIYAGGPKIILQAFRRSLPTVAVSNLIDLLNTLQFTYPYHQCIGFYLSQAGLDKRNSIN